MFDFGSFTHLSFDCYGTLVDWETGILEAAGPALRERDIDWSDEEILRRYAYWEAEFESDEPHRPYREVLESVWESMARDAGLATDSISSGLIADSLSAWACPGS